MPNLNKRWTIALFASLALNVFLLGGLSVHLWGKGSAGRKHDVGQDFAGPGKVGDHAGPSGKRGPRLRGQGGPEIVADLIAVMGGPRDPRVRELWQARRNDHVELRTRMQSARKAVHAAMAAEPFDKQKLETALAELQQVSSDAQRRAQAGAVELAQKLTPAERARLEP